MKMGAEIGISIGYRAVVHEYQTDPKTNDTKRLLKEVDLYEISLVTIPMCDGARVTNIKAISTETPEEIARRAAVQLLEKSTEALHASLAIERACAILKPGA